MVKKHNLELVGAEDGAVVLELAKAETPKFVLLDVSMPKVSGIECGQVIKELSKSTHVVLISSVHSLSLQDSAKRARIDLFTVESVANVKVPEFVEAMLNRRELPPDASEAIEREILSKRGATRFPFEGEVQYQIGEEWLSGHFVNVSQDGLLFQSKNAVQPGSKIVLSWMDQGKKHIEIHAITIRQIPSEHPQYPYLIGVQFLKSHAAIDQKIAEFSDEIDTFQENTAVELDLDLIQELLNERGTYFRDLFQGGKVPLFVELSINDVVEHERTAFSKQDDYSICLQELVSSRILSQMLGNSVIQLFGAKASIKNYSTRLVNIMSELLEKIEYAEGDADKLVKRSIQENKIEERHRINESNSRLYQAKGEILKIFCQKVCREDVAPSHQSGFDEIVRQNDQLVSYQQHLDEMAKEEERERKAVAKQRIQKPIVIEKPALEPKKKTRMIVVEEEPIKKTTYIPIAALIVILVLMIPWVETLMKVHFSRDDLKLLIEPKSIERVSNESLKVDLPINSWTQLDERGKEIILDQIEVYLVRKKLHQAKVTDGDRLIAAVYGSGEEPIFLRSVFLDEEVTGEPVKAPVVIEPVEVQDEVEPAKATTSITKVKKLKPKTKAKTATKSSNRIKSKTKKNR